MSESQYAGRYEMGYLGVAHHEKVSFGFPKDLFCICLALLTRRA